MGRAAARPRPRARVLLAGTGKRVDRAGEARLAALVEDARTLASRWRSSAPTSATGRSSARRTWTPSSRASRRIRSSPSATPWRRDSTQALGVLDRAIADGEAFMLLGSLASTVRRLLVERERARRAAGDRRITSYNEWQSVVLPSIPEEELGGKKPYGFWMKYQAAALLAAGAARRPRRARGGGRRHEERPDGRIRLERVLVGLLASGHIERSLEPASPRHERAPLRERIDHLGHLVEYIQTDVYVRFRRACGDHGPTSARRLARHAHRGERRESGMTPKAFVEKYRAEQHEDFKRFGVEFSTYYTTDSPENARWAYRV